MIRTLWALVPGALAAVLLAAACDGEETESNPSTTPTSSTTSSSSTTTSSTSSTSSTTSSQGGSGGSTPLTCDQETSNFEGDCDLFLQNCPDGLVCVAISNTTAGCEAPQPGLKGVGATCSDTDECSGALSCIDDHCTPVCCPGTDEPCAGGKCDIHVTYGNEIYAMMCSYPVTCTVFEHDCPDGKDCHVSDFDTGFAVCDSPSATYVEEGEPCYYRNDCGDSQMCNRSSPDVDADAGVSGRCRYLCSVQSWESLAAGDGGCPEGQSCHDLNKVPDLGKCY